MLRIVALDWATIAASTVVAMFTVLLWLLEVSVPPVVKTVQGTWDETRRAQEVLKRLGVAFESASSTAVGVNSHGEKLSQLRAAGELATWVDQAKSEADLAWSLKLEQLYDDEIAFVRALAKDPCEGAKIPPEPRRNVESGAPPIAWLEDLERLARYRAAVFEQYDACRQESRITVDETSLRFKVNSDTTFTMSPGDVDRGIGSVLAAIDDKVLKGNTRNIFVRGHSDSRGTCDPRLRNDLNFRLSYGRAWYLAQRIRDHLVERGFVEGRDYLLTVAGFGASRPKPCRGLVCRDGNYDTENRRIEIAFQRLSAKDVSMMRGFPTAEQLGPPGVDCVGDQTGLTGAAP